MCRDSELDIELGSHYGSQQDSAAVSSHEGDGGDNVDEDEAAAAADFTPMTDEKRVFVNDWIAKLETEALEDVDDQVAAACIVYKCLLCQKRVLTVCKVVMMQDTAKRTHLAKILCTITNMSFKLEDTAIESMS